MYDFQEILNQDPQIAELITKEAARQEERVELIASENFVSKAVMAAMGSPLTNKYAEGYPGKRYCGGCEYVDEVENLAFERAKKLFNAGAMPADRLDRFRQMLALGEENRHVNQYQ